MDRYYLQTFEGVPSMVGDTETDYLNFQEKVATAKNDPLSSGSIDIPTQVITPGNEYTIIDEDEYTITYVDENGNLHIDPKAKDDTLLWIIAAASVAALII